MKEQAIFEYWNQSDGLIHHRKFKADLESIIKETLKKFSVSDVQGAIANYSMVMSSDKYFWTHSWTLGTFLTVKNMKCAGKVLQWWRFMENNFVEEKYLVQNATQEGFQRKIKLYPIPGRTCYKCSLPAVHKNSKGSHDTFTCIGHSSEEIRELYE